MNRARAFLLLALFAVLAACAQESLPPGPRGTNESYARSFSATAHASCTIASGLVAPVRGTLRIAIAYGQLMLSAKSVRYAYPAIGLEGPAGKAVLAAFDGRARYVANEPGFGPSIVLTSKSGAQALYASFGRPIPALMRGAIRVRAGERIATSGLKHLRFAYAPAGKVTGAGTQINPCGSGASNGAGVSVSLMPLDVAVTARFHALALDGTPVPAGPYPSGSPDVPTPVDVAVASVVSAHALAPSVYEQSDTFSEFYVVLCGNAVFATGHARYAGPFPYPHPTASSAPPQVTPSLPPVVFFRDAGTYGSDLIEPLPAPYSRPCPAPPPANIYTFTAQVFGQVGQTNFMYYWLVTPTPSPSASPAPAPTDFVTFKGYDTSVVTITPSPSPLPVFSTQPPAWPPPSPRAEMRAAGVGTTTIEVDDSACMCTDHPITVTVKATPTAAPVPTPLPNT